MDDILLEFLENGQQAFVIKDGEEKIAEMIMKVSGNVMTIYHTEVSRVVEGKGLAMLLLKSMVEHARKEQLKVVPQCVFVQAQFKRHPGMYADILQG